MIPDNLSLLAIGVTVLLIVVSLKGIKGQKEDSLEVKYWLSRNSWQGELETGTLQSWRQTSIVNNYDHYYLLAFEADIGGSQGIYKAATVLNASEVSKLRKGLSLTFKYQGVPPKKIAVIDFSFGN